MGPTVFKKGNIKQIYGKGKFIKIMPGRKVTAEKQKN
jgi:glycerol kinase